MKKTFQHSYHEQRGENTSERTTCRHRTQRPEPSGPDIMCLPNNEWGFLLSGVKHFQEKLVETLEEYNSLNASDTQWISHRLVEAKMLIDLIECPEFRRGYCDWYESVSDELELIAEKQSPKLL